MLCEMLWLLYCMYEILNARKSDNFIYLLFLMKLTFYFIKKLNRVSIIYINYLVLFMIKNNI